MKKLKLILSAAVVAVATHVHAQFGYWPPIIFVPGGGPVSDCMSGYVAVGYVTNEQTGSVFFPLPHGPGPIKAHLEGFDDVGIKVLRNDGVIYCSQTNGITVQASTNLTRKYKFILYYFSQPPTNVETHFVIEWPEPWLKITDLRWPEGTNNSEVTFLVNAPATNAVYQLWYSQTLTDFTASNWIPHSAFYGQANPFTVKQTAHMTTNRPYGFWMLKLGSTNQPGNIDQEDVDPPIGWPVIEVCTNCPVSTNGPFPPTP